MVVFHRVCPGPVFFRHNITSPIHIETNTEVCKKKT